ncbi:4Fe-4S binding protein [Ideonella sp.]|uniref:4Fe-4S binding protein n=1 Tax=Ideonella sp. TaxID=1929293 RepID=UPI0039C86B36
MQRRRGLIQGIQWAMVGFYVVLVVLPACLPLPPAGASIVDNLTLFAQFVFWGLWWPLVIAATMLLGRVWCGVFCPEGALTEWASRHGRGGTIPRWVRWRGWPTLAFIATTVYGQLISVYDYPQATLLILGGSTLAAMLVGYLYGQGKRVWCRYLCPVSGVFALLAKVAPLHFRADEVAWRRHQGAVPRVDCGPLLNLRHLDSASACHSCGRCSGHRGAIELAIRSPNAEILGPARPGDETSAGLLVFGLLGVAVGAFQWSLSSAFVTTKQAAAEWLVAHDHYALLADNAPWWLLTHQPAASDVFSWLDGVAILAYIGGYALLVGGLVWLALGAAVRVLGDGVITRHRLAMALVPLAGAGLVLGLSMTTANHLRAEGVPLVGLGPLRALVLGGAACWSLVLGTRLLAGAAAGAARRAVALTCYSLPVALMSVIWVWMLFGV